MAFNDLPIIDNPSINSEKSSIAFKILFSQSNGFISREDIPDKGCDFDVELILDGTLASNWRFAVQLKSVINPTFIQDGAFISYQFETSRLGYLINRKPAMGIIVLYSVTQEKMYYEYVDVIFNRLMEEKQNDTWKQNDTVSIKIPAANALDKEQMLNLHSRFKRIFENAGIMQASYGSKYNLPTVIDNSEEPTDFNNPNHVKKMLRSHGIALLSSNGLQMVLDLVSRLPMKDINSEKELQIVAAVTYCEAGRHAEASYYFERLRRRQDVSVEENETVIFAKLKNDMSLGKISIDEFSEKILQLRQGAEDTINGITLDINITHFNLIKLRILSSFNEPPSKIYDDIQTTFQKIKEVNAEPIVKAQLESWNTDNFSQYIAHVRGISYAENRVRESINQPLSLHEKKEYILKLDRLLKDFYGHLQSLEQASKDLNNLLLLSNVYSVYIRDSLSQEIDMISFYNDRPIEVQGRIARLKKNLGHAISAYKYYEEQSYFNDAYNLLCSAIDLIYILRDFFGSTDDLQYNVLNEAKEGYEREFDFSYNSPFPKLISSSKNTEIAQPTVRDYKEFNDEQIEFVSGLVLSSLKLPEDRLKNVINEFKAYRLFYTRCTNQALELIIYDPFRTEETRYSYPTQFVIQSRISGLKTPASTDMEELLRYWKL
ncbi:MAG: DUF4365 domain-containing protein [Flavipsychrobacter sp.]|nr:DUF4365 domain-containing protein [Flavipsychrobacter sp.]